MGTRPPPKQRRAGADVWTERARARGYPARSVFKLEALDRRFRLLKRGQTVLDLGCHPGSWLLYAARAVGKEGRVVGVALPPTHLNETQVRVLTADVFDVEPSALDPQGRGFDLVLSDMAPNTTGVADTDRARSAALAERSLELALTLLRPGGAWVAKIFGGPETDEVVAHAKGRFARVQRVRPDAVRKASSELYLVGVARSRS